MSQTVRVKVAPNHSVVTEVLPMGFHKPRHMPGAILELDSETAARLKAIGAVVDAPEEIAAPKEGQ